MNSIRLLPAGTAFPRRSWRVSIRRCPEKSTTSARKIAQEFEQANQLLKRMAESTGGCAYFPTSAREFHSVDAEIAQLVRHE